MSIGAPKKFSDKQLKDTLAKYMVKNPGKKVNPSILEKHTGISRFIWTRRLGDEIKELNQPIQQVHDVSNQSLPLPNIVQLIETHWNNKTGLINALSHYNEMLQSLYEKALRYQNIETDNKKLLQLLQEKDYQIKELFNEIKYLNNQYLEVAVKGTYQIFQEKEDLKNIIGIKNNKSKDRALSTDYIKSFPELFCEDDK